MATERPWIVLPHEKIVKHESNLWTVEGRLFDGGARRRMSIIRLSDGRLLIHSAVPLDEPSMKEIEAWGPIAFIVPPNAFHDMDVGPYSRRYPDAKVLCDPKIQKKIAKRARVDGTLSDLPTGLGVRVEPSAGTKNDEPCFIVESEGRTSLIFTDAMFNVPHFGGFVGFMMRVLGSTGGPRVTRVFKLAAMKDKVAYREHLEKLTSVPNLARLVVAHGAVVENDIPGFMREVMRSLA